MNNDIKIILFDLGRVLMHIDFDAFPNGLGLITKEHRSQYNQAKIQQSVRGYETGEMSTNEFIDSLYEIFHQNFSKEKILSAFNGIIVKDNQEIIPVVENVRRHYRIAVLSNTCASHWEKVLRISSLIKLFPDVFTSFQLGAMKPSSIVYKKVCEMMNVEPYEVLFIDDLKENIDGAITAGMSGIVFQNIDSVKYLMKK
ncbi:MAG: HAD-IA family hydrolase [Bacteroidota bacterium]|nr:HAD-IA family hydrolase [Bacteroidota bacterium]